MLKLIKRTRSGNGRNWYGLYKCFCGNEKEICIGSVNSRNTTSCGCIAKEKSKIRQSNLPEYHSWQAMKQRCTNPRSKDFKSYGGRGITVCDSWLSSFSDFVNDMGKRPEDMTIERTDNDGPYAPGNCKWATRREQCNNRRSSRVVTAYRVTLTIAQWARVMEVPRSRIEKRLSKGNYSEHDAIFLPKQNKP
tara:strand:+ start:561 stop:1136 length:576 start_codon:yes stop_codon:yes gene_type:complete